MQRTERTIEINAPVERVFDFFSDFEDFPRWMKNIKEVRRTGRRYTRWTADAPLGSSVEWEAETTVFEPNHRIAWRTVRGDVDTEGEVIFEETRRGATLMRVVLGYEPPAGRLGSLVARLFGKDPEQQLEEDLERFADVVEGRGEAMLDHYKEDEREPRVYMRWERERRRRSAYDYEPRAVRSSMRRSHDADDPMRDSDYRPVEYRARGHREEQPERWERERRARFEEALGEARRRQQEDMRRYQEERARDEQRRHRDDRQREYTRDVHHFADRHRAAQERDEQGRATGGRWQERQADEPAHRRLEEEHQPESPRYALTPREREQERARHRANREYSKETFRRGVDKLMDEPPSRRWHRWE